MGYHKEEVVMKEEKKKNSDKKKKEEKKKKCDGHGNCTKCKLFLDKGEKKSGKCCASKFASKKSKR